MVKRTIKKKVVTKDDTRNQIIDRQIERLERQIAHHKIQIELAKTNIKNLKKEK